MTTSISYIFNFPQGKQEYTLNFDENWSFIPEIEDSPAWTELNHHPCPSCPLLAKGCSQCPLAVGVSELVERFKNETSCDRISIEVITPDRTYSKHTDIQIGLQSILGLIMATSGCPKMTFLKPMARFHLPFSTLEETMTRSLSFFLLRQFFHQKKDRSDYTLESFQKMYQEVTIVNRGLLARIGDLQQSGDADQNAIVILGTFAQLLIMNFKKDYQSLRKYFMSPEDF